MDEPQEFTGNTKQPGLYYVETEEYFPLRGNGWYSQAMIKYCIKNRINEKMILKVLYMLTFITS